MIIAVTQCDEVLDTLIRAPKSEKFVRNVGINGEMRVRLEQALASSRSKELYDNGKSMPRASFGWVYLYCTIKHITKARSNKDALVFQWRYHIGDRKSLRCKQVTQKKAVPYIRQNSFVKTTAIAWLKSSRELIDQGRERLNLEERIQNIYEL